MDIRRAKGLKYIIKCPQDLQTEKMERKTVRVALHCGLASDKVLCWRGGGETGRPTGATFMKNRVAIAVNTENTHTSFHF